MGTEELKALKKLIADWDSGRLDWDADFLGQETNVLLLGAFTGSLDSAKALHDAVLPGWGWRIQHVGLQAYAIVVLADDKAEATDFIPARAWALAIIRALLAEWEAAQ